MCLLEVRPPQLRGLPVVLPPHCRVTAVPEPTARRADALDFDAVPPAELGGERDARASKVGSAWST